VCEVLWCITLLLFPHFSRITVWLLMLITFLCAEPAALGTLGLVKGSVRTYSFSLYIFIAHIILNCADPCPEHG